MTFEEYQRNARIRAGRGTEHRVGVIPWKNAKQLSSPSNAGLCLQGYFFKYATPFYQGDRYKCILKGAFDDSLKSDHIRALLEHNDALEFGHSRQNLILHSNETGISFRVHLRNDPISFQVRALVE